MKKKKRKESRFVHSNKLTWLPRITHNYTYDNVHILMIIFQIIYSNNGHEENEMDVVGISQPPFRANSITSILFKCKIKITRCANISIRPDGSYRWKIYN